MEANATSFEATSLDAVFGSLADPTRRDILRKVAAYNLTVGQIVEYYNISFPAISKHLKILERAGFIIKRKVGRKHFISLAPAAFKDAAEYIDYYTHFWESNLDSLKNYMERSQNG